MIPVFPLHPRTYYMLSPGFSASYSMSSNSKAYSEESNNYLEINAAKV